ncbi:Uncharacterised protein [Bordetella pertussis]|nr:Uncharacterised protein [Bordetella pertussis]
MMMEQSASTMLTASSRPPRPTSSPTASRRDCANRRRMASVVNSK